jgi:hypothetical protein
MDFKRVSGIDGARTFMDEEASKRTPRRVQMVMVFAGSEVKTTRKMVYSQDSVTCSSIIGVTNGPNSGGRPGRFG